MPGLVLGPVLRHVDETSATVWVQTDAPCEVEVLGRRERTFEVDGHFFALVVVRDLEPGTRTPYGVALDGERVWPPERDAVGPSEIPTLGAPGPLRLAFGSCRECAPGHGPDALRALAVTTARAPAAERPAALLLLGDQLYADEPPHGRELVRQGHDGPRADDFAGYARLYREAWEEPAVRWLLSAVPTLMVFDDHEVLDRWKITQGWVDAHRGDPDYERRVTAGLMAYWAFQHLGNRSPAELEADELYAAVRGPGGTGALRAFAHQADRQAGLARWSYARDLGGVRLVVLDSRASRCLDPGARRLLDEAEWSWAAERIAEGRRFDHLLVATSLPFLLPRGLHDLQAAVERLADRPGGGPVPWLGDRLLQGLHAGHWAAFQGSFRRLLDAIRAVAADGGAACVTVLSGDVHHGYLALMDARPGDAEAPIWQVVASPFRKRLGGDERAVMRLGASRTGRRIGAAMARMARVAPLDADWTLREPPSTRNQVAVLEADGRALRVALRAAGPGGERLSTVWEHELAVPADASTVD